MSHKVETVDALLASEYTYPDNEDQRDELSAEIEQLKLKKQTNLYSPVQPISAILDPEQVITK